MVLRQRLVFCLLHRSRNTQGNIYGKYLGNIYIYIYRIYKEYLRNIHKYLCMIENSQKHRPNWAAAECGTCVSDHFISKIFMDIPYIFHIYSIYIYIYIYFLNMFHLFSLVDIFNIINLLSTTFDFVKRS